jgi:hypothetical protein
VAAGRVYCRVGTGLAEIVLEMEVGEVARGLQAANKDTHKKDSKIERNMAIS